MSEVAIRSAIMHIGAFDIKYLNLFKFLHIYFDFYIYFFFIYIYKKNNKLYFHFNLTHTNTHTFFMNQDNLILSSSDDYIIKLWSTEPTVLQSIKTFTGHTDYVRSVCFSPNFLQDNLILSGSLDRTIKLWSTESGLNIKTFTGHTEGIASVCFAPSIDYSIFSYMKRSVPNE